MKERFRLKDQPTGSDIYVSVEMSRSKWVVGIHTPLADKIGLHTMACGDVDALLALIDRTRAKLIASGSNSPAALVCYEAGYEGFLAPTAILSRSVSALW